MWTIFTTFIANFLRGWLGDKRAAQAQRAVGRSDAIVRGQEKAQEIADEQVKAAVDRPSGDELLERLRRGDRL